MDYFKFTKIKSDMKILQICILLAICIMGSSMGQGYGFDGGSQCTPKNARRGRAQLLATIPCDLTIQAYCNLPGTLYPWHAVRRFVHENQGLMKRMYGDIRHISVLRTEINNNDIELEDIEKTAIRYSRTNWKKNKYLYQSEYSKHGTNNDVLSEPHFRIASPTSSSSSVKSKITNHQPSIKLSNSNINNNNNNNSTIKIMDSTIQTLEPVDASSSSSSINSIINNNDNNLENLSDITTGNDEEIINDNEDGDLINVSSPSSSSSSSSSIDVHYNSIYENVTENHHDNNNNENIKIINSPNLKSDLEQPVTLSTTLKIINRTTQATTITSDGNSIKTTTTTTTTTVSPASSTITVSDADTTGDTLKSIDRIDHGNIRDGFGEINNSAESGISTSGSSFDNYESYISGTDDSPSSGSSSSSINSNSEDIIKMQSIPKVNTKITANIKDIHPKQATKFNLRPTINNNNNNNNNPNSQHMEGQLFQDVVPKDSPAMMNSRGVNACPVKEEVVAPFWANNTRGEVLALLNLYPFEQYVHWEKCTNEHKQMYCRDGCRCEQQYRLHRLLAYDPHNECRGIFSDWFRFPSCCICKCYDIPIDYRVTSRSPRSVIDHAEETVKNAIYEHATEDWYRHSNKYRALNDIGDDHHTNNDEDNDEENIDEEIDDENLFL